MLGNVGLLAVLLSQQGLLLELLQALRWHTVVHIDPWLRSVFFQGPHYEMKETSLLPVNAQKGGRQPNAQSPFCALACLTCGFLACVMYGF